MHRQTKDKTITCRITADCKAELKTLAKEEGITLSEYIERRIISPTAIANPNQQLVNNINIIARELPALGNNLNQIARAINVNLSSGLCLPEYVENPQTIKILGDRIVKLTNLLNLVRATALPSKSRKPRSANKNTKK